MKMKFHFPKCPGAGGNPANANLTLSRPAGSLSAHQPAHPACLFPSCPCRCLGPSGTPMPQISLCVFSTQCLLPAQPCLADAFCDYWAVGVCCSRAPGHHTGSCTEVPPV